MLPVAVTIEGCWGKSRDLKKKKKKLGGGGGGGENGLDEVVVGGRGPVI